MTRLSKQSIRALCEGPAPMISPFEPGKIRLHGTSKGLSHASYDASIAHDLVLGRHPGYVIKEWASQQDFDMPKVWLRGLSPWRPFEALSKIAALLRGYYDAMADLQERLEAEPPCYSLAHTVEDFNMPPDVGGDVADKSTFARLFVSLYNTFFDPGFHGNATLEIVNDSDQRVHLKAGQGVCQFIFTWLDETTEDPYSGKYQGQTKAAHGPRYEDGDGIAKTGVPMDDNGPREYIISGCKSFEEAERIRAVHGGHIELVAKVDVPAEVAEGWFGSGYAPSPAAETRRQLRKVDATAIAPGLYDAEAKARQRELDALRFGREPPWETHHREREAARDRAGLGQG